MESKHDFHISVFSFIIRNISRMHYYISLCISLNSNSNSKLEDILSKLLGKKSIRVHLGSQDSKHSFHIVRVTFEYLLLNSALER